MKKHHRGLIDLHLHLDGSLSLPSVKKLAALSGTALPDDAALLKQLQIEPDCRDLNEYLTKFAFPCSLLQTEEAIALAVQTLCEELQEQGLMKLFNEVENPLVQVLAGIEKEGISIDANALADISMLLEQEIKGIETRIFELADTEFNIGSPKQLGEVLFERLDLPYGKKTKTGYYHYSICLRYRGSDCI